MNLYEINPLEDERWNDLVEEHAAASLFHSQFWLDALRRTYGYQPVVFTDSPPGQRLINALLFCRVRSWMTGRRLVSLPFSDHCEPLVAEPGVLVSMLNHLRTLIGREGRYIEIRPIHPFPVSSQGFRESEQFCLHFIDLRPTDDIIFGRFHRNHTQRAIRKAGRVGLTVETGRSRTLLAEFRALHTLTRGRQGVPVQPSAWFQNVVDSLGERATIWVARHEAIPVAAILTAVHRRTLIYKYGCSDPAYRRYGGTQLLFWRAIQAAKAQHLGDFDLGRTSWDNPGLLAFKDHLGGERRGLTYYRCTGAAPRKSTAWMSTARMAYSMVPKPLQVRVGAHFYKHFA